MKLDINNYPGAKGGAGVFHTIINNTPDFEIFYELFGGSGIIGRKLYKAGVSGKITILESAVEVYNDLAKLIAGDIIDSEGQLSLHCLNSILFIRSQLHLDLTGVHFYADPPYLKSTRGSKTDLYLCEWDEKQHKAFIYMVHLLAKTGATIMISHYPCELYDKAFSKWRTVTFRTRTRKKTVVEKIYMNYTASEHDLATYKYLGDNCTERQRILRRKEAYLWKFKKMNPHERQCILEHVLENLSE